MKQRFLLFAFLCACLCFTKAKANETEPNDKESQANTLALNGSNSGMINPAGEHDWFKVTTTVAGRLRITFSALNGADFYAALYNSTDSLNALGTVESYSNSPATLNQDGLAAGTYFVKIYPYYSSTGSYTLADSMFKPAQATDPEPNNYAKQAITLTLNGKVSGQLGYVSNGVADGSDWYKVVTTSSGLLRITLSALNGADFYARLYSKDTTTQLGTIESYNSSPAVLNANGLAAGTYYIQLYPYSSSYGAYTLADSLFKPAEASDSESNNYAKQADILLLNAQTSGQLGYSANGVTDGSDWYKVTTTGDGLLRITLSSLNGADFYARLYDKDTTTQLGTIESYNSIPAVLNANGLAAGTYYIQLYPYSSSYGAYTLADSLFTPSKPNDAEPDNHASQALTLPLNSSKTGHLDYYYNNIRDTADWYKITTTDDGYLRIIFSALDNGDFYAQLYDKDTSTVIGTGESYNNSTVTISADGLAKGTYYVKLYPYSTSYGSYKLVDSFATYNTADKEPDGYPYQAATIPVNNTVTGDIDFHYNGTNDGIDWWKINYTGANNGSMNIKYSLIPHLSGGLSDIYFQVYADTAASAISSIEMYGTDTTSTVTLNSLQPGYYYIKVFPYSSNFSAYTIKPTFTQVATASIKVISYDTAASCSSGNTVIFQPSGGVNGPYTVQLYRYKTAYGSADIVAKGSRAKFTNLPQGAYYATAYADGATGNAFGKSATVSVEPIPDSLTTTNITTTTATFNWDTVVCASYYTVKYRKIGDSAFTTVKVSGATTYTATGLTKNSQYTWKVATVHSTNNVIAQGAFSDSVVFTNQGAQGLIADDATANKLQGSVVISPNPVTSYFTLHYSSPSAEKVSAALYDVTGRAVWTSGLVNAAALNSKQVFASQFANGVFYLKITNEEGVVKSVSKLVVAR